MDYILTTDKLTKKYGAVVAAKNISIHIKRGDIYGLIGKNGAGKTTILKMISGIIHPTSGSMNIMCDVGALIESPGFYPNMTAVQNVKLKLTYCGIEDNGLSRELISLVGLDPDSPKRAGVFSLGMKQRLGIALALVGAPDILVLDEPINGLDPQGIIEIRDIIHKLNKERGITFIIASHILEELSKTATRYGIMSEGELLLELSDEELNDNLSGHIVIETNDMTNAFAVLTDNGYKSVKRNEEGHLLVFDRDVDSADIIRIMAEAGIRVSSVYRKKESLEDFYMSVTARREGIR